jgi:hypothetical protein
MPTDRVSSSASDVDPAAEATRLAEAQNGTHPWKKWGPYLSERQWGTVREDYGSGSDTWNYFSHDQARSRAYRWGEDGLAGISDDKQRLCLALALWNGQDPILKERLFGLTNGEGNHGEDVKEYYFYLDSTPTHSYMRYLYKYPHGAYPYLDLVAGNGARSRTEMEYELLDTGIFAGHRYFDVIVEYAKRAPEEILVQITAWNRGPEARELHLLPQLWFRNTWSEQDGAERPTVRQVKGGRGVTVAEASHAELGRRYLYGQGEVPLLFTHNETNQERIFGRPSRTPWVKDAFHAYVIDGRPEAVNPEKTGTKMAAYYRLTIPPGQSASVRLLLTTEAPAVLGAPNLLDRTWDALLARRLAEADAFYAAVTPPAASDDEKRVFRQALAGMLWSKQYYWFDLEAWLAEHGHNPLRGRRTPGVRNAQWQHMINDDIISMPDKWEYPWYAAWDLAFHTVALNAVDPDFAKEQLLLMLREVYQHPNGQVPAYEWNFGDVNPPVHAFAALMTYQAEKQRRGTGDLGFLKTVFQKLLLNFSWWANRKDPRGLNVFEGGFLGLDNIGVFDRSAPLPTGGHLEQADGTAWMALFCQHMLEMALELALHDPTYEELAMKFAEHFFWIAGAMDRVGDNQDELWDEEDGFFYDLLHLPDGSAMRLKVRSMVGLLPLCATTVISPESFERFPRLARRAGDFLRRRPELVANVFPPGKPGHQGRRLLAVLNESKLRRVLARMLDEERFLGPHGIRSLSRWHLDHPYVFTLHGESYTVQYMPAESMNAMFGGNSNWRGPIWFPINLLIIRALIQFYLYFGDSFRIECPTGSGREMNLWEVATSIARRLTSVFLRDREGRRPVYGGSETFQTDPHWRDHLLFYEYFHGDNGAGLGASHQTGWTGVVARLIQLCHLDGKDVLANGLLGSALPAEGGHARAA